MRQIATSNRLPGLETNTCIFSMVWFVGYETETLSFLTVFHLWVPLRAHGNQVQLVDSLALEKLENWCTKFWANFDIFKINFQKSKTRANPFGKPPTQTFAAPSKVRKHIISVKSSKFITLKFLVGGFNPSEKYYSNCQHGKQPLLAIFFSWRLQPFRSGHFEWSHQAWSPLPIM